MPRILWAGQTIGVLLIVWQGIILLLSPPHYMLPSPLAVLAAFERQPGFFLRHGLVTLTEILLGFVLGVLFGALTAIAIAAFPRLGRLVWPLLLVLQAFPVFVIAPLLVLWFGFGMASKVIMAMIIIFFPVASAFGDGMRRIDRDILDAASESVPTHWHMLRRIRIPLALPSLLSGLRVSAPLAPLGAVIGEWVGASAGLGFVMVQANARMQTDTMFAAMTLVAILSLALRRLVDEAAPFIVPWAQER